MTDNRFFTWLSLLTTALVAISVIVHRFPAMTEGLPLSLVSIGFFGGLCLVAHIFGKRSSVSKNKNLLTQLIIVLVFVKLISSLVLVMAYDQIYHPQTNFFVLPFFFIYIVYTVFEVYVLTKANQLV